MPDFSGISFKDELSPDYKPKSFGGVDFSKELSPDYGLDPAEVKPQAKASQPTTPAGRGLAGLAKPYQPGSTSLTQRAGDIAVSAGKGVVGMGEAGIGALDLLSFGKAGKDAESLGVDFKRTQGILDTLYSPAQQAANKAVTDAQGFVPTLSAVAENPSVIPQQIIQSLPVMAGGIAVGKGAQLLAPKISPLLAGAIGEGGITAASSAESIRQQSPDGLLSPKQMALAGLSGGLTGAITGGMGVTANRLGLPDINQMFLGGDTGSNLYGRAGRTLLGGLTEGAQETGQSAQEQALSNLALDKPIGEGVGQAAALGGLTGVAMGGGASALSPPGQGDLPRPTSKLNLLNDRSRGLPIDFGGQTMADVAPQTTRVTAAGAPLDGVDPNGGVLSKAVYAGSTGVTPEFSQDLSDFDKAYADILNEQQDNGQDQPEATPIQGQGSQAEIRAGTAGENQSNGIGYDEPRIGLDKVGNQGSGTRAGTEQQPEITTIGGTNDQERIGGTASPLAVTSRPVDGTRDGNDGTEPLNGGLQPGRSGGVDGTGGILDRVPARREDQAGRANNLRDTAGVLPDALGQTGAQTRNPILTTKQFDYLASGLDDFKAKNPDAKPIDLQGARLRLKDEYADQLEAAKQAEAKGIPYAPKEIEIKPAKPYKLPVAKDTDELQKAIVKLGGLSRDSTFKAGNFSDYKGNKRLFHNTPRAKTLDGMAESLRELGFEIDGENDLIAKLDDSLRGYPVHTPIGAVKQAEAMTKYQNEGLKQQEAWAASFIEQEDTQPDINAYGLNSFDDYIDDTPEDDYVDDIPGDFSDPRAKATTQGQFDTGAEAQGNDVPKEEEFKGIPGLLEGINAVGSNKPKQASPSMAQVDLLAQTPEEKAQLAKDQGIADLKAKKDAAINPNKPSGGTLFNQPDINGQMDATDLIKQPAQKTQDSVQVKQDVPTKAGKVSTPQIVTNDNKTVDVTSNKLSPAKSLLLKEAHKSLGRDITRDQVQNMLNRIQHEIDTGKTNNGGAIVSLRKSALDDRKRQAERLRYDLGLFNNENPVVKYNLTTETPIIDRVLSHKTNVDQAGYINRLSQDDFEVGKQEVLALKGNDAETIKLRRLFSFSQLNKDRKANLAHYKASGEFVVSPPVKEDVVNQAKPEKPSETAEPKGKSEKFSKSPKTQGSTIAEVRAMLNNRQRKLLEAGRLEIVQDIASLPKKLIGIAESQREALATSFPASSAAAQPKDGTDTPATNANNLTNSLVTKARIKKLNHFFDRIIPFNSGNIPPTSDKGLPYSLSSNTKFFGDVIHSNAFIKYGFGGLDIKTRLMVFQKMRSAINNDKVGYRVMETVGVNVVNDLVNSKLSSKVLFHNEPMLKDKLSFDAQPPIPVTINRSITKLVLAYASVGATKQTGLASKSVMLIPNDFLAADDAGKYVANDISSGQPVAIAVVGTKDIPRFGLSEPVIRGIERNITSATINDRHVINSETVDNVLDAASGETGAVSPILPDLSNVQGLFDGETIYLVADNLNKDIVQPVLMHELWHYSEKHDPKIQEAIARFDKQLRPRFELAKKGIGTAIEKSAAKRVIASDTSLENQLSEFKAYMVEEFNKAPESLSSYIRKAIQEFFAAIRAMLIRNGFIEPKNISAAELSALAQYGLKLNRSEKPNSSKVKKGSGNVTLGAESKIRQSAKAQRFYSALNRAFISAPEKVFGNGRQVSAWLQGNASKLGVKADEIYFSGITDWLNMQGKVSRDDVLGYLKEGGVTVQDVELGESYYFQGTDGSRMYYGSKAEAESAREEEISWAENDSSALDESDDYVSVNDHDGNELFYAEINDDGEWVSNDGDTYDDKEDVMAHAEQAVQNQADYWLGEIGYVEIDESSKDSSKYQKYAVPGGENYQELLLTLPGNGISEEDYIKLYRQRFPKKTDVPDGDLRAWYNRGVKIPLTDGYIGKNTPKYQSAHFDQPNIIAHTRFDQRTDADGNKTLFVQEIQSDWGQDGRDKGFDRTLGVPPAPFVQDTKSWVALAIKKLISDAVDNNINKIAFINGEQAADLYDLRKQIDTITYLKNKDGDKATVRAIKNNSVVFERANTPVEELPDIVGKDVAGKIANDEGELNSRTGYLELSGLDLKQGGEGMKAFYDTIVPSVAREIANRMGGEVVNGKPNNTLIITPTMRDKVVNEGMPLFSKKNTTIINGIERQMVNSEGKPIHSTEQGRRNFWKWFGGSKVIDDKGRPLVVYHGTGKAFNKFDGKKTSDGNFWFTSSKEKLLSREAGAASHGEIMPVYLSAKKLAGWDEYDKLSIDELVSQGYDGISLDDDYVVFNPNQIKSAAGNTGDFSANNNDIRYSKAQPSSGNASTPIPSRKDKWIYNNQDRFIRMKRKMQEVVKNGGEIREADDPYLSEELYHQRSAYRIKQFYDKEMNPILQGLHRAKIGFAEFQKFLHARHAEERNKAMAEINPNQAMINKNMLEARAELKRTQSGTSNKQAIDAAYEELARWERAKPFNGTEEERLSLSGMSNADANQYISGLSPEQRSKMSVLADKIDAITKKTLDTMAEYGLETASFVEGLKRQYDHYAPMYRDDAHPDDLTHPVGMGFSVRGSGLKTAVGSNAEVTNILAHIAQQREQMIRRGEKNIVTVKLANFLASHPDKDFAEVGRVPTYRTTVNGLVETLPDPMYTQRENVVMFRVKGKDIGIVFNDKNPDNVRLAQSLKNMDGKQLDAVEKIISKGTRWIAAIATQWNVIWGMFNFIRDTQGSMLNLTTTPLRGKQLQVLGHLPSTMEAIWATQRGWQGIDPKYKAYYESFNKNGATTGYSQMFDDIKDRSKSLEKEMNKEGEIAPLKAARAAVKAIEDFNAVSENAVRLATYIVGIENGLSEAKSASIAKNISVNFNRKGANAPHWNTFYAFFNASIQSNARTLETLSGPAGKKIIMTGVSLGIATTVLGILSMGADEWDKIPEWEKERSLIFHAPGTESGYIKLPLPLGLNILPNIGRVMVESVMGSTRYSITHRLLGLMGAVASTSSPINGNDFVSVITPTIADPAIDLLRNKDYTGKSIEQQDFNSLDRTPGHSRAKDTATAGSKWLSRGVNFATGGTEYMPGLLSPTPDAIDYVIGSIFGGTGKELARAYSAVESKGKGEDLPPNKWPVIGKIYGETKGDAPERAMFYDTIKTLNQQWNEVDGLRGDKKYAEASAYISENPEVKLYQMAKSALTQVNNLRKMKERDEAAGRSTKSIDSLITARMKAVNDRYLEAIKQ